MLYLFLSVCLSVCLTVSVCVCLVCLSVWSVWSGLVLSVCLSVSLRAWSVRLSVRPHNFISIHVSPRQIAFVHNKQKLLHGDFEITPPIRQGILMSKRTASTSRNLLLRVSADITPRTSQSSNVFQCFVFASRWRRYRS